MSIVRPLLRIGGLKNIIRRSYHAPEGFKYSSMNDLPVPQGSWQAQYDANNGKYNIHLLVGIVFATATIVAAKASGLVYMNYYPPVEPADE